MKAAKTQGRSSARSKRGSDNSVIALENFVQATRDSGYKGTPHAVAELVDNSLQAGAKVVAIEIRRADDERWPVELVVRDSGRGMDRATLRQSLRFGGSTRFDDRRGLGRYGMGLPNASLSQARKVAVYSWQKKGQVYSSYIDVDEIVEGRLSHVPLPTRVEYPLEGRRTNSGTVVIWRRCDRLDNKRISTIERKLRVALGRRFRYFIWRGVKLTINGRPVDAIDPLCLHADSVVSGASQFGETLEYEVAADPDDPAADLGLVRVTFSELPVRDWHDLSNREKRARGISKGAGVSVVRAGREVDYGWFFLGGKRRENYDDWWRCEIHFDPVLDEAFGITHTKQQVRPKAYLVEALAPDMEQLARALNARARKAHLAAKAPARFGDAERVAAECDARLPAVRTTSSREDRRLLDQLKKREPALRKSPENAAGTDYAIVAQKMPQKAGTSFYTFAREEGRFVLVVNPEHPFYRELYKPLLDSEAPRDKALREKLALVLLAAARAEAEIGDRGAGDDLEALREAWSDNLAAYLNA